MLCVNTCIRFAKFAIGASDFSISCWLSDAFFRKMEIKNSSADLVFKFNSIHWKPSLLMNMVPRIEINTAWVIVNGRLLARIPKFELRPPKSADVRREKVAAEATSRRLAIMPRRTDTPQMTLPLMLKVSRIFRKTCIKVSILTKNL